MWCISPWAYVVVKLEGARFFWRESAAEFIEGPGEIVAVVIESLIGVLAGVKAAVFLIGEDFVYPGDDAFGGFAEERAAR